MDTIASWRTSVLAKHLSPLPTSPHPSLENFRCLEFCPAELDCGPPEFDTSSMRKLLDGHNVQERDALFNLMASSELFRSKQIGGDVFLGADFNQTMESQREITMKRIRFLLSRGVFRGWLTSNKTESSFLQAALQECFGIFDHSLTVKIGVHFSLWGGAIQFLGTSRHHKKWLKLTEDYVVKGCFAMTELGHGSNVRGIETIATYDPSSHEFMINTPSESAQKYWIGGAANDATHAVVFAQLHIAGKEEGVHAFIVQIRDESGSACPGIRIADCGHKIGLNGVDNGRLWFDRTRVPRENLLNSVADVLENGQYVSSIQDCDQRFGAFMAPLTFGRVTIAVSALYQAKIGLATTVRYALTRRAFSLNPGEPEVLLLDYPSHQRRIIPLVAKTYALSFAANKLKELYVNRTPADAKTIHVLSSGFKAMFTWHNIRTLQECREACGGQGLKSENRVGQLKSEYDVQLTFEGDNNVLVQQVSKALLAEYFGAQKKGKPVKSFGLQHVNDATATVPPLSNSSYLRERNFHISLFQLREQDLLYKLASEVSMRMSKGVSMSEAVLLSYQLAEDLGHAFSERSALEIFVSAESSQPMDCIKHLLELLRSLYVLSTIDENPVFLRYGYVTTNQAKAIQREIVQLCGDIRPHVLALVDSFGIPKSLLGPIAFDWIKYNSWDYVNE